MSERNAHLDETVDGSPGPVHAQATTVPGEVGREPERFRAGARVGPYRIVGALGAGGMGVVYRVQHTHTGGTYALKTLLPGADADLIERFRREGEAQARVGPHPGVVAVHSLEVWEGRLCLVMDLAEGGDLADRLKHGPLPPREAARIVRDLALGLAHTHAQGVLHRDLKPANVILDAAGSPRLVDFGLAYLAGAHTLTRTGTILGTVSYMAPEQARGAERVGPAADVYGLGALLYATLTGTPPFSKGSEMSTLIAVCEAPPLPPSTLVPEIDADVEAICLRCLAKEPQDRYPTAGGLAAALTAYLDDDRSFGAGSLRVHMTVVSALALLLLGSVGVYALRPDAPPGPSAGPTLDLSTTSARQPNPQVPLEVVAPPAALPDQAEYDAAKRWLDAERSKPKTPLRKAYEAGWYRSCALRVRPGPATAVPKSSRLARELFREAAQRGDVASMLDLANELTRQGDPGAPSKDDRRQALPWAIRALERGAPAAHGFLARRLTGERRPPADRELALELATQFVESGRAEHYVTSRLVLSITLRNSSPHPWPRIERLCREALVHETHSPLLPIERQGCETLLNDAQQRRRRTQGGLKEDPVASRTERAQALIEQARAFAQEGGPEALVSARLRTLLAARLGRSDAMLEIADMSRAGIGGDVAPRVALEWYSKATLAGVARAKIPLAEMLWRGEGLDPGAEPIPQEGRRLLEGVMAGEDAVLAAQAKATLTRLESGG